MAQIVGSSIEKLEPNKQLREAGYPFDHIGRELTDLQGKWEVVSNDVLLLKNAITEETQKLSDKVEESQKISVEKVEHIFHKKFIEIVGAVASCIAIMYGVLMFIKEQGIQGKPLGVFAILIGIAIAAVVYLAVKREAPKS